MNVVPAEVSEDVWVAKCRAGDRSAFRALYDLHYAKVHRTARLLGTPTSELEDVSQEVFTLAFSRLERFLGGNFGHWLHRICANVVTDRHRRRRVRETFSKLLGNGPELEVERGPGPEQNSIRAQSQRQIAVILSRMKPKHREVFALFELEGLTGEEISERVECPVGTVWTRLFHARAEFVRIGKQRGFVMPEGGAA